MNCAEIQPILPLYWDGPIAPATQAACAAHLQSCPLCRVELSELRAVSRDLTLLSQPVPPPDLAASITWALAAQAMARRPAPRRNWRAWLVAWLRPRVVPYTVGSFASVLLFLSLFGALRSSLVAFQDWNQTARLVSARETQAAQDKGYYGYDIRQPLSPEGLAALRGPVSGESPTLNPQGALAMVIRSLAFGTANDDMTVVADIFSDGSASLAGVMQPPRDPRLLRDVQRALRQNPAFVPAGYDRRPETIRVVFVVQSVDVK